MHEAILNLFKQLICYQNSVCHGNQERFIQRIFTFSIKKYLIRRKLCLTEYNIGKKNNYLVVCIIPLFFLLKYIHILTEYTIKIYYEGIIPKFHKAEISLYLIQALLSHRDVSGPKCPHKNLKVELSGAEIFRNPY